MANKTDIELALIDQIIAECTPAQRPAIWNGAPGYNEGIGDFLRNLLQLRTRIDGNRAPGATIITPTRLPIGLVPTESLVDMPWADYGQEGVKSAARAIVEKVERHYAEQILGGASCVREVSAMAVPAVCGFDFGPGIDGSVVQYALHETGRTILVTDEMRAAAKEVHERHMREASALTDAPRP